VKIYVLVSDVGLNGYVIHGVYASRPAPKVVKETGLKEGHTTGYQYTTVEEHELQEEEL
jgi:hypothetical protein